MLRNNPIRLFCLNRIIFISNNIRNYSIIASFNIINHIIILRMSYFLLYNFLLLKFFVIKYLQEFFYKKEVIYEK